MKNYKIKLNTWFLELRNYFYKEWNNNRLWLIDKNTNVLLNLYLTNLYYWYDNEYYCTYVWDEHGKNLFEKWEEYCNDIINKILDEMFNLVNDIIEDIKIWNYQIEWKEWSEYNLRLNYYLTKYHEWSFLSIKKITLFPNAYTPNE